MILDILIFIVFLFLVGIQIFMWCTIIAEIGMRMRMRREIAKDFLDTFLPKAIAEKEKEEDTDRGYA